MFAACSYVCFFISIASPAANGHVSLSFHNPTGSNFRDYNFDRSELEDSVPTATPISQSSGSFYSSDQLQDAPQNQ